MNINYSIRIIVIAKRSIPRDGDAMEAHVRIYAGESEIHKSRTSHVRQTNAAFI